MDETVNVKIQTNGIYCGNECLYKRGLYFNSKLPGCVLFKFYTFLDTDRYGRTLRCDACLNARPLDGGLARGQKKQTEKTTWPYPHHSDDSFDQSLQATIDSIRLYLRFLSDGMFGDTLTLPYGKICVHRDEQPGEVSGYIKLLNRELHFEAIDMDALSKHAEILIAITCKQHERGTLYDETGLTESQKEFIKHLDKI